ncbi:Hpt domain-containing protein [Rhodophyticola sp. MJ-SS7]|nr:Hpt domain-containing protein [Rhodophyticola sp. MJ-SS7]MDU8944094.1 Hpt domain-containing protein [Rhodophyticola sp. MJ-SS7]
MLSEQIGRAETVDLLDQFIEESDNLVQSLSFVEGTPDARHQLSQLAHKSAGSASVFRSQAFAGLLRKLETVLREDETAELPAIAAELETCLSATRKELMECRDDMTPGDGNGNMGETQVQIG